MLRKGASTGAHHGFLAVSGQTQGSHVLMGLIPTLTCGYTQKSRSMASFGLPTVTWGFSKLPEQIYPILPEMILRASGHVEGRELMPP